MKHTSIPFAALLLAPRGVILSVLKKRLTPPGLVPVERQSPDPLRILAILFLALATAAPGAEQAAWRLAADLATDTHTVFLLQADAAAGTLLDRTGRFQPLVAGGAVIDDPAWGACLKFGDGGKNGISLKDDGKIGFEGGVQLDAWVCFDEPPPDKGASLALKVGSFSWDIAKGKLNTAWLVFPSEEIHTAAPQQFKYYPVGGEMINGFMNLPLKKWVRITVAYDEGIGAVITGIDGMTDRLRYRYRGPQRLQCDGRSPIAMLQGFKNCRIGALRLSSGRPKLNAPALEAYANALPFQDRVLLTFDHIDPALPLPIGVTLVWEKASGSAETVRSFTLDSHARRDVFLESPTWKNSLHTLTVNATAAGRPVLAKNLRVAIVKPAGPTLIHADRTISKDGKKFFPLLVYHALPEDFPLLASLGFNVLYNDFNLNRSAPNDPAAYNTLLAQSLDAAQQHHLFLITATNSTYNKLYTIPVARTHPAMLLWYGADEPWGDLTRLAESYNTIKMLEPNLPVLIVQNNYSRLQDTAPGADILATDPYPVPNVSLRAVADATQSALRAVGGQKPVWTIIPQYATKIPTRAELRCMAWLAIASGASGLGFFDWDERTQDPQTGTLQGWYAKEHPEQINDLRSVLGELRPLEHILLTPQAAQQPAIEPANPALHALLKEAAGKRYLILANDSRRAEQATLRLDGVTDAVARRLGEGGGNERLPIRNGKLSLDMPPLGAAVYELTTP